MRRRRTTSRWSRCGIVRGHREVRLSLDEHIRVAAGALARGLIDARGFVDAIRQASDGMPLERVWVGGGRLTAEQLAELRGVAGDGATVPVGGETVPLAAAGGAPSAAGSEQIAALSAWIAKASVLGFGEVRDLGAATQASVVAPAPVAAPAPAPTSIAAPAPAAKKEPPRAG